MRRHMTGGRREPASGRHRLQAASHPESTHQEQFLVDGRREAHAAQLLIDDALGENLARHADCRKLLICVIVGPVALLSRCTGAGKRPASAEGSRHRGGAGRGRKEGGRQPRWAHRERENGRERAKVTDKSPNIRPRAFTRQICLNAALDPRPLTGAATSIRASAASKHYSTRSTNPPTWIGGGETGPRDTCRAATAGTHRGSRARSRTCRPQASPFRASQGGTTRDEAPRSRSRPPR